MQVDYLIIGQGLCGTWLSWYLTKENRSFIVIDNNAPITPSKVSAGIINPVTGRRMVKVWMVQQVLSFAHEAYKEIGNFLGLTAISQKNIIDFFPNAHQRQVFLQRIEEGEEYLNSFPEQNQFNSFFNYELGCGEIRHSYIAHLDTLLPVWRQQLQNNGQLHEEEFEIERLVIKERSVQYRSVTGVPWTRAQPAGQPPYDLKFMMTGPQADFWFPVRAQSAAYTGQWYSENTMQGILAYRGQVTQALPGQTNRLVATIGDKQALGGYVKINEWNDYEIIARGGVMMHIMNGQLMAVFIDDNKDSVNNQPGLIGFEIESQPCKISVRDIWLRTFD